MGIFQTKNQLKNYANQLLENLIKKSTLILYRQYWGAGLTDMQLISKFNKEIHFLLCVIDVFSKQAWEFL